MANSTTKALRTSVKEGFTGASLKFVNDNLNDILHPLVVSRGALLFGVLIVLCWHCLRAAPAYRSPMMRTLGVALVIVNLYFNDHIESKAPFMMSIACILMDQAVLWYLSVLIVDRFIGKQWDPVEDHYDYEGTKNKVTNRYMKIGSHLRVSVYYFIVQFALMMYYVFELNKDPDTHDEQKVSFLKWFIALLIAIIAGENEVGTPFNEFFWQDLLEKQLASIPVKHFGCIPVPLKYEFYLRRTMSFIINKIFRTIVLGTVPILLSVADPLDFIKDCMAVFFMTKLDDLDDKADIQQELMHLKARRGVQDAEGSYRMVQMSQSLT